MRILMSIYNDNVAVIHEHQCSTECDLECPFGFVQRLDGCRLCRCHQPCKVSLVPCLYARHLLLCPRSCLGHLENIAVSASFSSPWSQSIEDRTMQGKARSFNQTALFHLLCIYMVSRYELWLSGARCDHNLYRRRHCMVDTSVGG